MSLPVTVLHTRPGGSPAIDLTPMLSSGPAYDSAAVGGFGSCSFKLEGDRRADVAYLGFVRVFWNDELVWEGQLEDAVLNIGRDITTVVRAFGLQRKLTQTTVRRVWSKRDIPWVSELGAQGTLIGNAGSAAFFLDRTIQSLLGNFDATDLTKSGVRVQGAAAALASGFGGGAFYQLPIGVTFVKVICDLAYTNASGNIGAGKIQAFCIAQTSGSSLAAAYESFSPTPGGDISLTPAVTTRDIIHLSAANLAGGALTMGVGDFIDFSDVRILGTTVAEDAAGGFYGGTLLRDLVALCPDLTQGVIDTGSDYTIQTLERVMRDTAASVVAEVAGYYTREWAVWENGRFDWKARNLDEAQWVIDVAVLEELDLDASVDNLARTVYVLYTDAASGIDTEASATGTDRHNPYVAQSLTKDITVQPGFPMTANTSAQLASRIVGDIGARPDVGGTCRLPATATIPNAVGGPMPAALIRGGDNVLLSGLPKSEPMRTGRDGETLFHVASTEVDLSANTVTLTLEGQQRRTDVILARLAAATRVLTG